MKKGFMAVMAMAAVAFIGYATTPAVAESNQSFVKVAKDQPPVGQRTVRTYIRPDGSLTRADNEAARVLGGKVGYFGDENGGRVSPPKPGAIQSWWCNCNQGKPVVNFLFECQEEAMVFFNNPNRERIAADWRAILDYATPSPDPSRPGACQIYLPMPKSY